MGENLPFVDLGANMKVIQIALGESHSCVLFESGQVKCWGKNLSGQLGLDYSARVGDRPNEMGENLPFLDFGTKEKVVQLALGSDHSCALFENHRMKCWGGNNEGQLGMNDQIDRGGYENQMGEQLPYIRFHSFEVFQPILKISAGADMSCAMFSNQLAKCWGGNQDGQLGQGHRSRLGSRPRRYEESQVYSSEVRSILEPA